MRRPSLSPRTGPQSGYDPRMLESCLLASPSHNPNAPGPRHTKDDDPRKAAFIDSLLKRRAH